MSGLPDWQDTAPYAAVLAGGRLALAWELLRRDPAYRLDFITANASDAPTDLAANWGLHFRG